MPNTLTIIRDDFQMADNPVAMQAEMTKEELVQEMIWIGSTGRPALTYQIVRQRRGICIVGSRVDYHQAIFFLHFDYDDGDVLL